MSRRGLTLLECLVTMVSASVVLAGFASLYTMADLAARTNADDINGVAIDYNLDRVLAEIASTTTAIGAYPTRKVYDNTDSTGTSPNCILVYERPLSIKCTIRYAGAKGPRLLTLPQPRTIQNNILANNRHPFPVFFDTATGSPAKMTNVDPDPLQFADNWVTGIIALKRTDFYSPTPGVPGRYRNSLLWHVEMPLPAMSQYALNQSFLESKTAPGYPSFVTQADVIGIASSPLGHRTFAGTRILGVGIQSFEVKGRPRTPGTDPRDVEPMTWKVER